VRPNGYPLGVTGILQKGGRAFQEMKHLHTKMQFCHMLMSSIKHTKSIHNPSTMKKFGVHMCEVTSGILVNFENGPMKLLFSNQVMFVLFAFLKIV
jgi:hypothetical protein